MDIPNLAQGRRAPAGEQDADVEHLKSSTIELGARQYRRRKPLVAMRTVTLKSGSSRVTLRLWACLPPSTPESSMNKAK